MLTGLGLSHEAARELLAGLEAVPRAADTAGRWAHMSRHVLRPGHPAPVHEAVFRALHADTDPAEGPPAAWIPSEGVRAGCNLGRLLDRLGFANEDAFRAWSVRDRAGFWEAMIRTLSIRFDRPARTVVELEDGPERPRWLPGASLNITNSCSLADPAAIAVRQHGEDGTRRELSYAELEQLSARVAAGLIDAGLAPGEAVGLVMPLTVEAVGALLGIVRAGGVAIGVAESFAGPEIALRLRLGGARRIITQESLRRRGAILPLYDKLHAVPEIPAIVLATSESGPRLREGDSTWDAFLPPTSAAPPRASEAFAPAILLFSSGTTGEPKAIPWPQTTLIKAAADGHLYQDIQPGDVVAWPSSPGWMMGPWLVFATLINRGTIALYDGHPGSAGFCRFVEEAGVTTLGVVPSLVAAWRAHAWPEACDWGRIKLFSSTGECSNPSDMLYLMSRAGYRPVIEYCGGTEIGGGYITSSLLRPNAPACFNTIAYGLDLTIRDERGQPADRGEAFLLGPSMGLSTELLNRDHHATYFDGTPEPADGMPLRRHGDAIERLAGGFYRVLGRVDDTMNLGGIKVSAVEIERVLNLHPQVREAAAVAVRHGAGGLEQLVAHVVPAGAGLDDLALRDELQALISDQLNPLFRLGEVVLVDELPRTASNKLLRRVLRGSSP